ncbi:MAG: tetratricopeptide repeat protein [Deltaproteobacteria bacterium]|nr:tetratricopeptide repeat protein [Deltaproteobacteria bacterium]
MSRLPEQAPEPARLPLWKRVLFAITPLCASLLLLESCAALLGFEADRSGDPFVGFSSRSRLYEPVPDAAPETLLETVPARRGWVHYGRFTPNKPHGQFRIFTLGGSTTYGRPYDGDVVSFPGWLRELLPAVDASHHWEVINAGGISYASYRAALVMEELVAYQPDLFIVYTGHNEFLERRTYSALLSAPPLVLDLASLLRSTRSWALLASWLAPSAQPSQPLSQEPAAILDGSVGPDAYTRDDEWAAEVAAHMRFNLRRMVDLAEGAGARILFVTPASNLAAFSPFRSEASDSLDDSTSARVAARSRAADRAEAGGELAAALRALDTAVALDPRNASLHYRRGRLLLALGRHTEAAAALTRARDEDVCPLRAPSAIVSVVREVAAEREVPLVDFEARAGGLSPDGVAGAAQFLDHVHPDAATYEQLAEWIIDALAEMGIVASRPNWGEPRHAALREAVMARIDRAAEAAALRNLAKVLGWAGLVDEVEALLNRALERNPDDIDALISLSNVFLGRDDPNAAAKALAHAAQLEPDNATVRDFHADALLAAGRTAASLVEYRALLALNERSAWTHNNLAWILANAPDAELRDPQAALAHAERASALHGQADPYLLDTLAAAQTALGDRDAALASVDAAIALARSQGDADQTATLERHRSRYAAGRAAPLVD